MYLLQFFAYADLTPELQQIAKPFYEFALQLVEGLPQNSERTEAVRRLLESRDAALRAHAFQWELPKS